MANLIEQLQNLTVNEIKLEVALLKEINIVNAAKETGNRMMGALAKAATSIFQAVSENSSIDYEVVRMADIIREGTRDISDDDKEKVIELLKEQLIAKCGIIDTESGKISDDRLSVMVVSEAAKMYNIPRYATFANKINQINIYYNKDFLRALHEIIKAQNPDEAVDFENRLQKRLDIISLDAKRDLQKKLFPKEFSGKGIARVLRSERGTKYLEEAVAIMGIECFDYISAYSYTAVQSLKGLNRMSRSVLAQLVWRAYTRNKTNPLVDKTKLPSYINDDEAVQADALEADFKHLVKKRIDSDKELDTLRKSIEKNEEEIRKITEKLEAQQETYERLAGEFAELEKEKEAYMSGSRPEPDTKRYYSQVNSVKRQIDNAESALNVIKGRYEETVVKGDNLKKEYDNKTIECSQLQSDTNVQLLARSEDLKKRWQNFYSGISFDDNVFGQVVLTFSRKEVILIEEMLAEYMGFADADALDTEPGKIYCNILKNSSAKISHEGRRIISIVR